MANHTVDCPHCGIDTRIHYDHNINTCALRAEGPRTEPSNDSPPAPCDDPLDSPIELTARVDALWTEWRRVEDEERELVRIPILKGVIRTALIRAQRDAAQRALSRVQTLIAETLT